MLALLATGLKIQFVPVAALAAPVFSQASKKPTGRDGFPYAILN